MAFSDDFDDTGFELNDGGDVVRQDTHIPRRRRQIDLCPKVQSVR
jgi:hypothetical protein